MASQGLACWLIRHNYRKKNNILCLITPDVCNNPMEIQKEEFHNNQLLIQMTQNCENL